MIDSSTEAQMTQNPCYVQGGDNLELLKSQPNESVNMIYCDILYGTGRNFGDYQDLKPIRCEIESHYLPRLIEMKRVLKPNGSIYSEWGGTGAGGGMDFGTKRYKSWYTVDNKWRKL